MALFSMRVQVIKRSEGRSAVAAAAYRAGERLVDDRAGMVHDYTRRAGVEHTEIMAPADAPAFVHDRAALWNAVEQIERRKDAQLARELRIMIPREVPPDARIPLVKEFVQRNFVDRGMVADVAWHNGRASDGAEQPHCHVMLTMRPLDPATGSFGKKSRHEMVRREDGTMAVTNPDSWNLDSYYETCRAQWETLANAALARAGSEARIDRRSYLERGLAHIPQPVMGALLHAKGLYDRMKGVMDQWAAQEHYAHAKAALERISRNKGRDPAPPRRKAQTVERFMGWIDRQLDSIERIAQRSPPEPDRSPDLSHGR